MAEAALLSITETAYPSTAPQIAQGRFALIPATRVALLLNPDLSSLRTTCNTHCAVWSTNQGVYYGYVTNCGGRDIHTAFPGGYDQYVQMCASP